MKLKSISVVLISRFMLHLQSVNFRATGGEFLVEDPVATNNGSLMFERVVGSLGASLSQNDYLTTSESFEDAMDS